MLLKLEVNKPFGEVIKEVLEHEVDGYSCLMISFVSDALHCRLGLVKALLVNKKNLHCFFEPAKTVFHLIQLGYDNNVEMDKVLNFIGNEGCTLFSLAHRSEKLTKFLLRKRVRVNTLDSQFQIPCLNVSFKDSVCIKFKKL